MNENLVEKLRKKHPELNSFELTNYILARIAKRRARAAGLDLLSYLKQHPFTAEEVREIEKRVLVVEQRLQECVTDAKQLGTVLYQKSPFVPDATELGSASEGISDGDS